MIMVTLVVAQLWVEFDDDPDHAPTLEHLSDDFLNWAYHQSELKWRDFTELSTYDGSSCISEINGTNVVLTHDLTFCKSSPTITIADGTVLYAPLALAYPSFIPSFAPLVPPSPPYVPHCYHFTALLISLHSPPPLPLHYPFCSPSFPPETPPIPLFCPSGTPSKPLQHCTPPFPFLHYSHWVTQ